MTETARILELATNLLLQVKLNQDTSQIEKSLSNLDWDQLINKLPIDQEKKAFWINIYNAFFLILRRNKGLDKPHIYTNKEIHVAGRTLSLDDIEHGIIRKYRFKWTLGYFPNLLAPTHIKEAAVERIDCRIHFALNCGAKSCPPIAFYEADKLDHQLDLATTSFLENETGIDDEKKQITVSRLFLWYAGDFGGKQGAKKILSTYLNMNTKGYKIKYGEYDWTEDLDNFKDK